MRPCKKGSSVACLNLKMSHVGVLSCSTSFDIAVGILARKDDFSHDFIVCGVAAFGAMSLVGTVEPLLSGQPRKKWQLAAYRGSSEISITPFKKVTLFQYKIARKQ